MSEKKKEFIRTLKFVLFSISAGVIQVVSFTLLEEVFHTRSFVTTSFRFRKLFGFATIQSLWHFGLMYREMWLHLCHMEHCFAGYGIARPGGIMHLDIHCYLALS